MPYQVYTRSTPTERSMNTVGSFLVTDRPDEWNDDIELWPAIAAFHVSMRHTMEEQRKRAYEYAAYMNSQVVIHPPIGT